MAAIVQWFNTHPELIKALFSVIAYAALNELYSRNPTLPGASLVQGAIPVLRQKASEGVDEIAAEAKKAVEKQEAPKVEEPK
jgi:hypothetical protein